MSEPIDLTGVDSFSVQLNYPPRESGPMEHRHMALKATDVHDTSVDPLDRAALAWLREKKGVIEFGKPYRHQTWAGLRVDIPARPVAIEIPFFGSGCGDANQWVYCRAATASGTTLRDAVAALQALLVQADAKPEDTYPGHNALLNRVLLNVGLAEFRVGDLCALIRDYYEEHSVGGALHAELDDGNMEDRHIDSASRYAREHGDRAAGLIAELLRLMPEDERQRLYARGYGR